MKEVTQRGRIPKHIL